VNQERENLRMALADSIHREMGITAGTSAYERVVEDFLAALGACERMPVERGGSWADASPRRKRVADALRGFSKEMDDPLGQLLLADRALGAMASLASQPVYEIERDRFGTMYSGPLEIGECLKVQVVGGHAR
jgi:hypothetical protein